MCPVKIMRRRPRAKKRFRPGVCGVGYSEKGGVVDTASTEGTMTRQRREPDKGWNYVWEVGSSKARRKPYLR